ncbi:sugar ABC transporter permease [Agromyces mediolanus]|uniref:carbohydrate ABC transporter permease n=1 Tax=Agromyces mediolanus TaxID=41986 RepID=UPI00203D3620|nr:sugar ABC transporter permease [Agromyces mediolanus]MCM3657619.1 sugar ABC transporter permease [Agromyces mediolanus]
MTATEPDRGRAAQPPSADRPRARRRRTLTQKDARTGLALMSPTLIIVLTVVVLPLIWAVVISFQELTLIQIGTADPFSGFTLENYERVLRSGALWASLATTIGYTIGSVVLVVFLGTVAALVVRRPFRGRTLVRAAFLLPYVAPVVAVTFVWRIMLNPEFGIVNEFGQNVLGWDEPIPFLTQAVAHWKFLGLSIPVPTALLTVIAFEGWRYFPFAFLFIMARLEGMSREPEEAALVDGAGPWQTFRYIVWPQLVPIIGVLAVLRTIWTFNEFDDIFLLTGGAAGTQVASVLVYELLTVQRNVGAASAMSVVLAVLLIVMLGVYVLIMRRRGESL